MAGASCETPRGSHSSGTTLARRLKQPTRIAGPKTGLELLPRYPYSALLPVGFALPLPSPEARCALAAPFHPYPPSPCGSGGRYVFCGTFPEVSSAGAEDASPDVIRHRVSVEPGLSSTLAR